MAEATTRSPIVHRVDPRLVHSTLLEAWLPYIGATQLVVVDAAVAIDPRRRIIFEMSARDVGRVHFVAERDLPRCLDDLPKDEPTLVVYSSLEGFADAVDAGLECDRVLIGHLPDGEGRRRVHPSVYVGADELDQVERIRGLGVKVIVRPLPSDVPRGLRRGEDDRPVLTEDLVPEVVAESAVETALGPTTSGTHPRPRSDSMASAPAPAPNASTSRSGQVEVVNERGLHLRAAHVLAQCTGRFSSSVQIGWTGRMVNAKSLLGITTLGAAQGSRLELRVDGEDADTAYDAIESLFASGFDEGSK